MDTEDLIIDDGCKCQVVEDLCAVAPYIDTTILSQALIVETVNLCDLSTFMVASNQSDSLWVSHLYNFKKLRYFTLRARSKRKVSTEQLPLSTKSPMKR